ncbi:restriction endonuclease subunit S [Enterococcus gallinarum]|uniref:restriction endonuclease subunit S n=1 Tax=Enterococcus gallinarum TaxID=1353 RepID=UPI002570B40A|nr:restriction endonuclease subunit S [Enterococcus gallinarum]MDL4876240.1 restriction endonuclease subunit S [Enterococcus gallinarum]MDL4885115.1 restriction endonuclease subunit S [Enterococcus gallinarum]
MAFGKEDVLSVSGEYGVINQIAFQGRSFAGESVADYHVVETDDIVYTKSPLKANPYGIIKVNKGIPGIVSTLYAVYHPLNTVAPRFVDLYFANDLRLNKFLKPLVNIGAKHDMKVNNSFVLTGTVVFPSIGEQQKLVDFFAKLDRRIEAQRKIVDTLKKYKRGLLNKVFSNINGNIYPTVYLSEVADFLQGLTYSPSDVSVAGYLVLRSSNIQNGVLSFDDCVYVDKKVDESLQVKCNDVIMCVRNGSKKLVGKTALIPNNMAMTTWGAFMMIIRSKLNDTYIFHYLNSQMFFSQVFKDTGTATINQITKGILNECKLPLPPETARKQISKMLSSFDVKIQNAEMCLTTLVELKKAFLQQLFI